LRKWSASGRREWRLPGNNPRPYSVYVDETDMVWLSDFGANAMVRFDVDTETFEVFELESPRANVRQILGRPSEVWGAKSGTDKLLLIRTGASEQRSRFSINGRSPTRLGTSRQSRGRRTGMRAAPGEAVRGHSLAAFAV
jgi:hypothetical protein